MHSYYVESNVLRDEGLQANASGKEGAKWMIGKQKLSTGYIKHKNLRYSYKAYNRYIELSII